MAFRFGLRYCVLLICVAPPALAQQDVNWIADVDTLATELPKRHLNLFHNITREEFEQSISALREDLPQLSDLQTISRISRIVASVRDGHTSLISDFSKYHFFPIQLYWFDDGIFVTLADRAHANLVGARLQRVGDLDVDQLMSELRHLVSHDNEQHFRYLVCRQANAAELLMAAGAISDLQQAQFQLTKAGATIEVELESIAFQQVQGIRWSQPPIPSPPLYQQKQQLDHWNDWIADSRTLYFKYNRCRNADAFNRLVNGTDGFVRQNQVDRFVLDLRDNSGGDSSIFRPLLNFLKANESLNQKGKLFVIIGRATFSSAVLNSLEMRETKATFVGEPTGGRPNHYGEVRTFQLPNSKMQVSYSTKYFRRIEGSDPESIDPDIHVALTSDDYFAGRDPVLQAILDQK